jgi:predicted unusual protein kinase regulating ubiquinone biosynthesis (AarF/ABC1/UbiB family)
MSFASMAEVLGEDLGSTWRDRFATFDEEPIAAASIGQVYRATLDDGRAVW